jgi:hypothetical protein
MIEFEILIELYLSDEIDSLEIFELEEMIAYQL